MSTMDDVTRLADQAGVRFHAELMWPTLRPALHHDAETTLIDAELAGLGRGRADLAA